MARLYLDELHPWGTPFVETLDNSGDNVHIGYMVSYITNEPTSGELPLFQVIAAALSDDIAAGVLAEGAQAPSTNEIAVYYRVNPATALKGVNQLVAEGILYKKRGIGMFVTEGARQLILARRRAEFAAKYVRPMLAEANVLGLTTSEMMEIITASTEGESNDNRH